MSSPGEATCNCLRARGLLVGAGLLRRCIGHHQYENALAIGSRIAATPVWLCG